MAYLVVTARGKSSYRVKLDGAPGAALVVGRAAGTGLWIHDGMLSRQHCRIFRDNGKWHVEDLGSTNGTLVNGHRIRARHALTDGEAIEVGDSRLVFHADAHVAARPADPIEAMQVQRMLDDMNDSRITSQDTLIGHRPASSGDSQAGRKVCRPQPRTDADATATSAGPSLAFQRPPAQPIVEPDEDEDRGWLRSLVAKVSHRKTTPPPDVPE